MEWGEANQVSEKKHMAGVNLGAANGSGGLLLFLGFVLVGLIVGALYFGRGKATYPAAIMAVFAAVFFIASVGVGTFSPASSTTPNAPAAATCAVQLGAAPALVSGETFNTVTNTLTVDLVYHSTNGNFSVRATNGAAGANPVTYVVFPLKLIRTDTINQTFSFPMSVSSIPTATSLGATPSVYSVVGYTTATSTSPGIWQVFFDHGVLSNQKPTVSAPSVASNVLSDGVPVPSFNSVTNGLHISLAGNNATSAPESFAAALQNFTAYPMTIGIGNGSPSVFTINFIIIGWTAA